MLYRVPRRRNSTWIRGRGNLLSRAVALAVFASSFPALLPAQTLSPQRQILLKRKAEVLKSIEAYQKKETEAQSTIDQATSMRNRYDASRDSKNAGIAAQAMDVAKQALANAQKYERDDRERLEAINRALAAPETNKPQGIPTLTRGHVVRQTPQGNVPFDPASPVRLGDRISTGNDGFLELQLDDGSQMHIGPNTDFLYERDVQGTYYELFKGELHKITILIGVRGATDQPRYRGLQAIAAVRGTDFTLEVDNGQDVFRVLEGEIEVDPGAGRAKIVVKPGQKLTVSGSGPVPQPSIFDPISADRWWEK